MLFLPLWSLICYLFRLSPTVCDWTLMCVLKGIKGQVLESSHPISSSRCPRAWVPQNTGFLQFRRNLAYRTAPRRCSQKYPSIDRWTENIWVWVMCVDIAKVKSEVVWHVTTSAALAVSATGLNDEWKKHLFTAALLVMKVSRIDWSVTRSSSAPSAFHSWINDGKSDVCLHRPARVCVTERFVGILLKVGQAYCVCQTKIISRPFPLLVEANIFFIC